MNRHLSILGVLFYIFGVAYLLVGLFFTMGVYTEFLGSITFWTIILTIAIIVVPVLAVFAGYHCFSGKKTWSRVFSLCLSFIMLFWIPLGTIIGGYGIWVLNKTETKEMFSQRLK